VFEGNKREKEREKEKREIKIYMSDKFK